MAYIDSGSHVLHGVAVQDGPWLSGPALDPPGPILTRLNPIF